MPAINTAALPFFRFVAACIVIFFHFGQKIEFYPQVPAVFKSGSLMVTFFFVLSGFVLVLGYHQRTLNWRQYWTRRAIKILPFYLLALLLSAWFSAKAGHLTGVDFILNLFCLQSWFPGPLAINFASWFVSVLLFCYCLFPPILFFLQQKRPDGRLMLAVSLVLWVLTQLILIRLLNSDFYTGYPSWSHDLIYYFPLSHFCSFFIGICGAYYLQTSSCKAKQGGMWSLLTTLALLGAVGLLVQLQPQLVQLLGLKLPFAASLYAPVMMLVLWHLTSFSNPLLHILSWPKFALWGEMSYGLFILQAPMDTLYKYFIPDLSMEPGIYFMLLFILLAATVFLLVMVEKAVGRLR